jgi:hypothetical protein
MFIGDREKLIATRSIARPPGKIVTRGRWALALARQSFVS